MSSVNKVILVGHLGRDPEVRHLQNGDPVCNFSIATSRKSRGGEEETEWHRVSVFGKQADACGRYLSKGRLAYVEGRIRSRKYTDKDGVERTAVEILADAVQFLSGGGGGGGSHGSERSRQSDERFDPGAYYPGSGRDEDDEIPF